MKKYFAGLLYVLFIASLSIWLHNHMITFIEPLTLSILIAIILRNTIGLHHRYIPGVQFAMKRILRWGIVLLGLRLNFVALAALGPQIFFIVLSVVIIGILGGYFIGKKFNVDEKLALLIGVGSAICGASAIVAAGPVIGAEEEDTTLGIAIISLVGTVGLAIYSLLAFILPLSDIAYGVWAGSSFQEVAHAVAASFTRGELSGDIGTLVKMGRVALLAPLTLLLGLKFTPENEERKKVQFPPYVIFFILLGIFNSLNASFNFVAHIIQIGSMEVNWITQLDRLRSWFILIAMVAMGLQVDIQRFKKAGMQAFSLGAVLFTCISLITFGMVYLFNL